MGRSLITLTATPEQIVLQLSIRTSVLSDCPGYAGWKVGLLHHAKMSGGNACL